MAGILRRLAEAQVQIVVGIVRTDIRSRQVGPRRGDFRRLPVVLIEGLHAEAFGETGRDTDGTNGRQYFGQVQKRGPEQVVLVRRIERVQAVDDQQRALAPVDRLLADLYRDLPSADER